MTQSEPISGEPRHAATTIVQEAGRGFVLVFGYLASATVSALVAVSCRLGYDYLLRGAESRAGLSAAEMLSHASNFGLLATAIILVFSVPAAWLPLALSLALMRRIQRSRFVACLVSGAVTASVLAPWLFAISWWILPRDDDRYPFWLVVGSNLPFALPAGIVGGLVLWAVCYRPPRSRFAQHAE